MEYVYFFREVNRPYVKIGMARNDINDRFQSFKCYAPLGAYIVGYIETKDCCKLEKQLHEKFKDKRLKGEFFNLTDDEVYAEINLHNKSFGQIIYLLNDLMNIHGISSKDIYEIVLEKFTKEHLKRQVKQPDPELILFLEKHRGEFLTSTEIIEMLFLDGYEINSYNLGLKLKELGYVNKNKRIGGILKKRYIL
jgi:hypothetical protein